MPRSTETQDAARSAQRRRGQTLDGRCGRWSLSADARTTARLRPTGDAEVGRREGPGRGNSTRSGRRRAMPQSRRFRAVRAEVDRIGQTHPIPQFASVALNAGSARRFRPFVRPRAGARARPESAVRLMPGFQNRCLQPLGHPSLSNNQILNTDVARPESAFASGFPPGAAHSLTRGGVSGFGGERRNSSRSRIPSSDTQATSQNASM